MPSARPCGMLGMPSISSRAIPMTPPFSQWHAHVRPTCSLRKRGEDSSCSNSTPNSSIDASNSFSFASKISAYSRISMAHYSSVRACGSYSLKTWLAFPALALDAMSASEAPHDLHTAAVGLFRKPHSRQKPGTCSNEARCFDASQRHFPQLQHAYPHIVPLAFFLKAEGPA